MVRDVVKSPLHVGLQSNSCPSNLMGRGYWVSSEVWLSSHSPYLPEPSGYSALSGNGVHRSWEPRSPSLANPLESTHSAASCNSPVATCSQPLSFRLKVLIAAHPAGFLLAIYLTTNEDQLVSSGPLHIRFPLEI
ncbi:hypothetical protein PGT21_015868 [Puccinia graminis f. sp. tritici]|uniref:Uncharacterized protein n=1 Tax=Puccinia graminis f. sp. tritici TaxID=56615 RepID=A0A5B0MP25_PUCGR|nr:hypothetical protein PGT21_015868 [Puccinia graminis f. sp. tritici]